MKRIITLICIAHFINTAISQELKTHVRMIGLSTSEGIMLRWGFDNYTMWELAMTRGFILERIQVDRVTHKPINPTFTKVTSSPIIHWSEDKWRNSVTAKDTYDMIAAQMVFGKTVKFGENNFGRGTVAQLNNADDEIKNRHGFAHYAAEMNFKTALKLGLGYLDTDIKPESRYIYRIYLNGEQGLYSSDTTILVVDEDIKYQAFSGPIPSVEQGDRKVRLHWKSEGYTAFYIERSQDGSNFTRLNSRPHISLYEPSIEDKTIITYIDSLHENEKVFYYRIIGINSFGLLSRPGQAIKAMGIDRTAPEAADIISGENSGASSNILKWKINASKDLKGFQVLRSHYVDKDYEAISDILPSSSREYTDSKAEASQANFYKVMAIDQNDNISMSTPRYILMKDVKAPDKVVGLKASISKEGVVSLSWNLGTEMDIKGYNIFRSNSREHQMIPINDNILEDTSFIDTIQISDLNEKVFYSVQAIDKTYKVGEMSEILELKKPDVIKPVAPHFSFYQVNKDNIILSWNESPSKDRKQYTLWRKSEDKASYIKIKDFELDSTQYIDRDVEALKYYTYVMTCTDDDGLISEYSPELVLRVFNSGTEKSITNLNVRRDEKANAILSWSYDLKPEYYIVYRKSGNNPLTMYKQSKETIFVDDHAASKEVYFYSVQAIFSNGNKSALSDPIELR